MRSRLMWSSARQSYRFGTLCVALLGASLGCSGEDGGGSGTSGGQAGMVNASGSAGASGGALASGGSSTAPRGGSSATQGGSNAQGGLGGAGSNGGRAATTGGSAAGGSGSTTGGSTAGGNTTGGVSSTGGAGGAMTTGGSAAAGGPSAGSGSVSNEAPAVRFVGRMDRSDAAGPKFAWSGSGIIARFNGTQVSAKLNGGQQYTVVIDGVEKPKLIATNGSNIIAQGLSAGVHTVELYRRTEAQEGEAQFLGFDFGGGTLLAPPMPPTRRLEIVGDSITCGYGNEGANMSCPFTPDTENHYLTYGSLAARDLGAELVTVAWSGKGVVCNYGDDANSCTNPMPMYYDRVLPNRANSTWDFSSYQPDAVIINLGTNDFSTEQDPTQAEFETAYKNLLVHIRSKYPNAHLLCTNGSMLSGTDLTKARSYIANVVQALTAAGDDKVVTFELQPQEEMDGYGCDWHPSLATHKKMAEQLKAALKKSLPW